MTVKKQFALDGGDLDASMDQLVEALAQLLDEPAGAKNQGAAAATTDLHSRDERGTHVMESKPTK
jgi:hypothetical protein